MLKRLIQWGLFDSEAKCNFFKENIEFMGFELGKEKLGIIAKRKESLADRVFPKTIKELQRFIVTMKFISSYIPGYTRAMKPFYALLQSGGKTIMTSKDLDESFRDLKLKIIVAFDLHQPTIIDRLQVFFDAIDYGIGGCVRQREKIFGFILGK